MDITGVQPITATYSLPYKTTEVLAGDLPGQRKIIETFYNVTIYDRNGSLQQVSNSYQVNYLV